MRPQTNAPLQNAKSPVMTGVQWLLAEVMNTPAFMQVGRVDAVVHALNTPYALDDAKLVQLVGKVQHTPIDLAVAQALSKLE